MAGDKRRARAEARLQAVEAEYIVQLRSALELCAAGHWGLFGVNDYVPRSIRAGVEELDDLAAEIARGRELLGMQAFGPSARLEELRALRGSNRPGEPKLAQAWLAEWG